MRDARAGELRICDWGRYKSGDERDPHCELMVNVGWQ